MLKRRLIGPALALFVLSVLILGGSGANSAFAGEITGNDKSLKQPDGTLHGRSECAFSGQNDSYSGDPEVPDEDGFFRTQNWGQIDKEGKEFLTSIGVNPGNACNPNRSQGEP